MPASTATRRRADKHGIALDTDKIRKLRLALGITQEEAARRAGLPSRQKWNDLEHGRRLNITLDTLDRIAAALGVKAKDLLK